tara:strand:- start:277 stop:468 length:192 start_codon:yes stop_codon:yes gene_type:complete
MLVDEALKLSHKHLGRPMIMARKRDLWKNKGNFEKYNKVSSTSVEWRIVHWHISKENIEEQRF